MQRLEVLVSVMLARERRWPADTAADGCTELAAALATLPSGLLEMVAEAMVALGCTCRRVRGSKALAIPHTPRPEVDVAPPSHTMSTVTEPRYSAAALLQPRTLLEGPMIKCAWAAAFPLARLESHTQVGSHPPL